MFRRTRRTRLPQYRAPVVASGGGKMTFTPPVNTTALKADFSLTTTESWFFY